MNLFKVLLMAFIVASTASSLRGEAEQEARALVDGDLVPYAVSLFVPPGQVKNGKFKCPGNGASAENIVNFVAVQIGTHASQFLQKHGVDSSVKDWSQMEITGFPRDFETRDRRRLATWTYKFKCPNSRCTCLLCSPDNGDRHLAVSADVVALQRSLEDYVEVNILADLKSTCGKANKFGFHYVGDM
jgi:hypothetical protein